MVVRLAGRELSWASVGDSLLLVASRGELLLVNGPAPGGPSFLGRAPLAAFGDALEVDAGTLVLEPDAVVLLATDGLEWDASGLTPAEIARILTGPGTPHARVERLLVAADGPAGGRDNLGVVLLAPQWQP
ncbi:MAG: hypothetical protein H6736_21340 [Alphaproteobacteria bacterium]|nr:hypothetical protein [Alphaproteobacteria bacterium]